MLMVICCYDIIILVEKIKGHLLKICSKLPITSQNFT